MSSAKVVTVVGVASPPPVVVATLSPFTVAQPTRSAGQSVVDVPPLPPLPPASLPPLPPLSAVPPVPPVPSPVQVAAMSRCLSVKEQGSPPKAAFVASTLQELLPRHAAS